MTKKKLPVRFTGQHFTIDKVLIKDAIRQANISNQDTVLDIGAGKGFLTVHLLKIANNVVAIENDTALVEHLRKLFSDARNVQVVGCDFRNFAVPKFPFKVVSNIPYGITSDIFKILMFESLGNFLGGSIVLQLEPAQKLFSRKLYNPYTVFYHTFFDLKLVYEVGPESFLPPPTVKSALLNIKRKHLFFDFKFKAKYLAFISCLLEKPDLSVKTALKSIFRKSQVRSISEKFGLNLNELAQGHEVIVGVDADELWHNSSINEKLSNWFNDVFGEQGGNHALIVAGIDTRDPNNIQVIVKDPGSGGIIPDGRDREH
jgi:23S rRNA (adenine-N6)-dimethyltransferase